MHLGASPCFLLRELLLDQLQAQGGELHVGLNALLESLALAQHVRLVVGEEVPGHRKLLRLRFGTQQQNERG